MYHELFFTWSRRSANAAAKSATRFASGPKGDEESFLKGGYWIDCIVEREKEKQRIFGYLPKSAVAPDQHRNFV